MEYDEELFLVTSSLGIRIHLDDWVIVVRVITLLICISLYIYPMIGKPKIFWQIIYAIVAAAIPFAIKFTLYILSSIVNRTIDVSSSDDIETSDEERPENVSSSLWNHAKSIISNNQMTEEIVMSLISDGYNSEEVYALNTYLAHHKTSEKPRLHLKQSTSTYIYFCGHFIHYKLTKDVLNMIYPWNVSLLYCIVGLILIFATLFLTFLLNTVFRTWQKVFITFGLGVSLITFLCPPDVEPYSQTKQKPIYGLTRLFTAAILFASLYACYRFKDKTINIPDFDIQIPVDALYYFIFIITVMSVGFISISIYFYIVDPLIFIHYILEVIDTYFFGCGLTKSLINAALLLLRGCVCFVAIYFISSSKNKYILALMIPIITVIIQFPLAFNTLLRTEYAFYILYLIFTPIIHYLLTLLGFVGQIYKFRIVFGIITLIVDFIFPYLSVYSSYLYCIKFKVIRWVWKYNPSLKYLTTHFVAPVMSGIIINTNKSSRAVLCLTLICFMTKSMADPLVFCCALFMATFTFQFDIPIDNFTVAIFTSLLVTRKLLTIWPVIKAYTGYRGSNHSWNFWPMFLQYLFTWAPLPTNCIDFWNFAISCIFGNTATDVKNNHFIRLPGQLRPNCFWEEEQPAEFHKNILACFQEHPQEAPVYAVLSRDLERQLASMISSGRLGLIDCGDILMMRDGKTIVLIEIISRDVNCVNFRMRGSEYEMTSCQAEEVQESPGKHLHYIYYPIIEKVSMFELIDDKFVMGGSQVAVHEFSHFFQSYIHNQHAKAYIMVSLASIFKDEETFRNVSPDNAFAGDPLATILSTFGVFLSNEDFDIAHNIYNICAENLLDPDYEIRQEVLIDIFSCYRNYNYNQEDLRMRQQELNKILRKFTERLIVIMVAAVVGVYDIDINRLPIDLGLFVTRTLEDYKALRFNSEDFIKHAMNGTKHIVTLVHFRQTSYVIFFNKAPARFEVLQYNSFVCRSIWQTFAQSILFYGEDDTNRYEVQMCTNYLSNTVSSLANRPVGYPAYVSPILTSYSFPWDESMHFPEQEEAARRLANDDDSSDDNSSHVIMI